MSFASDKVVLTANTSIKHGNELFYLNAIHKSQAEVLETYEVARLVRSNRDRCGARSVVECRRRDAQHHAAVAWEETREGRAYDKRLRPHIPTTIVGRFLGGQVEESERKIRRKIAIGKSWKSIFASGM